MLCLSVSYLLELISVCSLLCRLLLLRLMTLSYLLILLLLKMSGEDLESALKDGVLMMLETLLRSLLLRGREGVVRVWWMCWRGWFVFGEEIEFVCCRE